MECKINEYGIICVNFYLSDKFFKKKFEDFINDFKDSREPGLNNCLKL
jgi:hypothetical protein